MCREGPAADTHRAQQPDSSEGRWARTRKRGGSMSHRGKVRLAFLIAALALATVPFGSMIAQAHEKSFKSNLTLHYDKHDDQFNGHVGTAEVCKDVRPAAVHGDEPGSPVV